MKKQDNKTGQFIKTWTDEEESFLIENYSKYSTDYIAMVLGKSKDSINTKRKRLGFKKTCHMLEWTEEEMELVRNNSEKSIEELVLLLKTKTYRNIKSFLKNDIGVYKDTWDKDEDEFLINNYHKMSSKDIAIALDKSKNQVDYRAGKLNLKNEKSRNFKWTDELDEIVKKNYLVIPTEELSNFINCSKSQLFRRAKHLGLTVIRPYTDEDISFLRENYNNYSTKELATILDRTVIAIKSKLCDMGLKGVWWEEKDDNYLRENYKTMSISEMAGNLDRSYSGIQHRLGRLGLSTSIKLYKNMKFDSNQELDVFKYIESNFTNEIIKNSKTFYNDNFNEGYRPDFIINHENKPIIIEYFGMYKTYMENHIFKSYTEKAHRKIEYFNSLNDVYFIPLFPEDLKNNFEGVRTKLTSFLMSKNITLKGGWDK